MQNGGISTPLGDHILAIYDEKNEISEALNFLKQGLEKNQSCMLITDRISKDAIRDQIVEKWNADIGELEANRNIILKTPQQILFPGGNFRRNNKTILWKEWTDIVTENDKSGLRIFIDTSAMFKTGLEKQMIAFESSLDKRFDFPCTVVCAYTPEDLKNVGKIGLQKLREHHNIHWHHAQEKFTFLPQGRVRKCKTCGKEFETDTDEIYCSFKCTYNIE